jgi:hypothetical protein
MAEATAGGFPTRGICGRCGEPIEEESGDPAQRKPCPKCGSTSRVVTSGGGMAQMEFGATALSQTTGQTEFSTTADARSTGHIEFVASYPQELMYLAHRLIGESQPSLAVIVVHMACEIATERALSDAFDAREAQYLKDWVMDLRLGYNLANPRVWRLYTALTGDQVQQQVAFWLKFKTSADLRNDIIHKGRIATEGEAEASHKAGNDLLEHLWSQKGARPLP